MRPKQGCYDSHSTPGSWQQEAEAQEACAGASHPLPAATIGNTLKGGKARLANTRPHVTATSHTTTPDTTPGARVCRKATARQCCSSGPSGLRQHGKAVTRPCDYSGRADVCQGHTRLPSVRCCHTIMHNSAEVGSTLQLAIAPLAVNVQPIRTGPSS